MSGYSADWGGPLDMWEEKQKECDFKTARITLLEGDIRRLERELEAVTQDREMSRRMWAEEKGLREAVEAQLECERGCDWAGFDGGMG